MKRGKLKKWLACLLAIGMMASSMVSVSASGADISNFRDAAGELHYLWAEPSGEGWEYNEAENRLILNNLSGISLYFMTNEADQTLEIILNGTNQLEGLVSDGYHLVFSGDGTLSLTGKKTVVESDEANGTALLEDMTLYCYDSITVNSGTLNVFAAERSQDALGLYYGIYADSLTINGGAVSVTVPDPEKTYYEPCSVTPTINGGKFESNKDMPLPPVISFENGGFYASCQEGVLEEGAELQISKKEKDGALVLADKQIPTASYELYGIRFVKQGQAVQPSGNVAFHTAVPDGFDPDSCAVYRQESDGEWTKLDASIAVEDGEPQIAFLTDHFSLYAIVDESAAQPLPESPSVSEPAADPKPNTPDSSSPDTGDSQNPFLWAVFSLMLTGGAACTILLIKKQKQN